jgi:hypothetical protein
MNNILKDSHFKSKISLGKYTSWCESLNSLQISYLLNYLKLLSSENSPQEISLFYKKFLNVFKNIKSINTDNVQIYDNITPDELYLVLWTIGECYLRFVPEEGICLDILNYENNKYSGAYRFTRALFLLYLWGKGSKIPQYVSFD